MKPDIQTITSIILDGGYHASLPTIGSSMFPVIRTGDRITIEAVSGKPSIGDIIVFQSNGQMICHRLVKTFKKDGVQYYQTRGDAFFKRDMPITYEHIIGRVIQIQRTNVSIYRRILLILSPITNRFTILNAAVVRMLIKTRLWLTAS